jgi:hypothetical protein
MRHSREDAAPLNKGLLTDAWVRAAHPHAAEAPAVAATRSRRVELSPMEKGEPNVAETTCSTR